MAMTRSAVDGGLALINDLVAVLARYRENPNVALAPWVCESMFIVAACCAADAGIAPAYEFLDATDAVAKRAGAIRIH